jgi:hypothetical protein
VIWRREQASHWLAGCTRVLEVPTRLFRQSNCSVLHTGKNWAG